MLTTTGMASATAKNEKRVTIVFLAAVALIIGAASVSVYSQMGGTYFAPTLAKDLPHQSELLSEINRLPHPGSHGAFPAIFGGELARIVSPARRGWGQRRRSEGGR